MENLKNLTRLYLNLVLCRLGNLGVTNIGIAISKLRLLKTLMLDFQNNDIEDEGIQNLAGSLSK